MFTAPWTRREALAALAASGLSAMTASRLSAENRRQFRIAACDWSIGTTGDPEAIEMAARIGLDGVQVSFGAPGGPHDLRQAEVRERYLNACREHKVEIASLAMSVLNSVPYASSPDAARWVEECLDVMPKLGQRVVLLAFFGKGDIKEDPAARREVARRLRQVAPRAERAGLVLGIESWLDADEHLALLDAVASPAVKVYYDVANMESRGYDIYREIRQLGRERICEVHCKENGSLLGKGRVDFLRVRAALDEIGWSGWLVIEGAVPEGVSIVDAYRHNQRYLRSVFPTGCE